MFRKGLEKLFETVILVPLIYIVMYTNVLIGKLSKDRSEEIIRGLSDHLDKKVFVHKFLTHYVIYIRNKRLMPEACEWLVRNNYKILHRTLELRPRYFGKELYVKRKLIPRMPI